MLLPYLTKSQLGYDRKFLSGYNESVWFKLWLFDQTKKTLEKNWLMPRERKKNDILICLQMRIHPEFIKTEAIEAIVWIGRTPLRSDKQ